MQPAAVLVDDGQGLDHDDAAFPGQAARNGGTRCRWGSRGVSVAAFHGVDGDPVGDRLQELQAGEEDGRWR